MQKFFSIKYKLVFILTLTVVVTLLGYFLLATTLFEEDKIAYVYSTTLSLVSGKEQEFDTVLRYNHEMLDEFAQLIRLGNDQSLLTILPNKKEILYFACDRYSFRYKELGKNHITSNDFSSGVRFDIKNKLMFVSKEYSKGDHCEVLFKVEQLFNTHESLNGLNAFFISKNVDKINPESSLVKEIRKKIIDKKLHSGVKEIIDGKDRYLFSFTQLSNDLYYVLGIPRSHAIAGIDELKEKTFLYFLVLVSFVGIVSIIIANRFSIPILELTQNVLLFGEGKFEVRSKVQTKDELGQIAKVFNEMAFKISNLVEEVRIYSTQLEVLVKERTAALKKALGLQKAMINSLEQGFFMVNSKLLIMSTYSKSAQSFFGNELEGKGVEKILRFNNMDEAITKVLFRNMFSGNMPFESIVGLAPKFIQTVDGKSIQLGYEAVYSSDNKVIGIVVISSDKTESLRLEAESLLDKSRVSMVLKIVNNRYCFSKLLDEVKSYLQNINSANSKSISREEAFLFAHTMKGCFLLYHMRKLAMKIHELETEMKGMDEKEDMNLVVNKLCMMIDEELNLLAIEYPFLFGGTSWKELRPLKTFSENEIVSLIAEVKDNKVNNIEEYLIQKLLFVSFDEMISPLKEDIFLHAKNNGKRIDNLEILGGELRVNPADFSVHLQYVLHLTRNSIDHGIETPQLRLENGKNEGGHIIIELKIENEDYYSLSIFDDGKGLNAGALLERAAVMGIETSNLKGENIYQVIFYSGFSTAGSETETSGRGVGMSAIKSYIDGLKGVIKIESDPGHFLKITMLIPRLVDRYGSIA